MGYLNKHDIEINKFFITPKRLFNILDPLKKGKISSKQAKDLFFKVLEEQEEPETLIKKYGMEQLDNEDELEAIIDSIIVNSPNQVSEYKNGKTNLFDYFVGQTMKETRGKANPIKVKEILTNKLS